MGKLRTINHPGIENQEVDMSGSTEQLGGTTTLVMGFFPQGESNKPVRPTTISAVKSYFGTPTNEAERYAYYASKTAFDNGGNLIVSRIPYNNNSQYITPATKYKVEEWSTKHVKEYEIQNNNTLYNMEKASFNEMKIGNGTTPSISGFYYDGINGLGIYTQENVNDEIDNYADTKVEKKKTVYNAIRYNGLVYTNNDYYDISFTNFFIASSYDVDTENDHLFEFALSIPPDTIVKSGNEINSFTVAISGKGSGGIAEVQLSRTGTNTFTIESLTGEGATATATATVDFDNLGEFKITIADSSQTIDQPYVPCYPIADSDFDVAWLTQENMEYNENNVSIYRHEFSEWTSSIRSDRLPDTYYTEELYAVGDASKTNFCYDATHSSPVTALVDAFTTEGTEKRVAIKAYYISGDGTQYPDMDTEDYLELRIWDSDEIKELSDLTVDNLSKFDIIRRTYAGVVKSDYSVVSNPDFKSAPMTADVTEGYDGDDDYSVAGVNSTTLSISSTDVFDPALYPQIADRNPFGNGFMKVLVGVPGNDNCYSADNFFQFISPYSSIRDVALKGSNKYQWIHWYIPSAKDHSGKTTLLSKTMGCADADVPIQLSEVENIVAIHPSDDSTGFIPLSEYQDYRDGAKKPDRNTIVIANITEQKFGSDIYNNAVATDGESANDDYSDEVLGIVPVLMSGFQALPRQSRIELPGAITNSRIFDAIEAIKRGSSIENDPAPKADHVDIRAVTLNPDGFVKELGTKDRYDAFDSTYSNDLISTVPAIDLNAKYKPNGAKMNYVTLAVCQLSLSSVNDNKVALTILETFTGSLDPNAKAADGQTSVFIDNVVNNEDTGSTYVRLYSNYESSFQGSETANGLIRESIAPANNDTKVTLVAPASLGSKLWWTKDKPMMTLGFTDKQTKKEISYATIVASIENTFDALSNVDEEDIDIVVDGGISTIANYIKRKLDENPELTKAEYDVFWENIDDVTMVGGWKSMCSKFTTFCQTTRKDCIALLDAPRNLCVKDNVKLAQPGGKYSVDFDILPKFNYIGTMNSSYAAGYCDWILAVDDFSSRNMWMPPSIAAEGAIIYTDRNSNYWMAPAGQSRGNITWAVDVAFNPNSAQQDSIYSKGWNYALNSSGTIMVWGQKTMLNSSSSFNRINVRRLFCRLERLVRKNSKWVIFEINNERTRNIYKDRVDPIFANVKAMGGISRYEIICDARNNTPAVVDAHEFRCAFLLTPESVAEYIILTFFNVGQNMDFSEVYGQL